MLESPIFAGVSLANLPTTVVPGRGEWLFRISHRFVPATHEGYEALYGLDGPAVILVDIGYGITDRLSLALGRSNLADEVVLSAKTGLLDGAGPAAFPLSAAIVVELALDTEKTDGESFWDQDNARMIVQLPLAGRFGGRVSALLEPSFSSNADPSRESADYTLALGLGVRVAITGPLAVIAETSPVLDGYKTGHDAWAFGIEALKGGHVFHVFICNVYGIAPDRFMPGGDLDIADGDYRLGFNIYRTL